MRRALIFIIVVTLLCGCKGPNDENRLSIMEKGDAAFARREYLTAANIWKKAYAKNQKDVLLIDKLGDCYLKLGRLERSKIFFQKAVEIDPDNINSQIKLAQVYILTGELSKADKICETLGEKNVVHPELDLINADISLVKNQLDKAEAFYRKAVLNSQDALRPLMKLAIFLKSIDRDEEAVEILDIVKKNPVESSQIYLLTADYFLLDNQYDKAEQSILDAIRVEPEDQGLKYHLAQFYIATQNNTKAETTLETILENQDDIYLKMMLSDIYILNNKLEKAEEIILKLKKEINESTVEFELLQGKFWLYSGVPAYTTSHLKAALELRPDLANTRYFLGLTHLINQKSKLSENALIRTLQINPNHYPALLLISELLYKRKEYDLSLKYLDQLLKSYPEDFTGHIIKGLNLLGKKEYPLAKEQFEKSTYLSQKIQISYYYLGLTEELSGNNTEALNYYKQVLDISPDLIDVAYRYCMLLVKTKQNKAATDFINKRLADRDKPIEVYYLAAKVALKMEEYLWAETLFKKAILSDDAPGYIFMELAEYYKNNHKIKKSIETLNDCIKRKPYFQDAWLALSQLYVESQQLIEALEIMEKGYSKFEDSPLFQSNLAWLLLENEQEIDKAFPLAQSAYEMMPDNPAFADTLGWAYYHKGIFSQAIWLFSEVAKKEPDNGFVQYHLGMTYYRQGEIDKAKKFLNMALESEVSPYFFHKIDEVLNELSKEKPDETKTETSLDENSLLLPPENNNLDEDFITPQWKQ